MNAQELKDFQERDRREKDRQAKAEQEKKEQQEKADKAKEEYQKASQKRYEDMTKKHDEGTKAQEAQRKKEEKQLKKAMKPHSDLGKAREKLRKSPEHEAMRKAIKEQVADRQQTAKEGAAGPHVVRDEGQQAEVAKYSQMQNEDRKMAAGTVGKAHGSPEPQGLNGGEEFEAQQAKAAHAVQGEPKPWERRVGQQQQDQQTPAHAHAKPWHERHGGHPDHLGTILKDKSHAAMEGEKPWARQHADPDHAESRMAQQSRSREREEQSR